MTASMEQPPLMPVGGGVGLSTTQQHIGPDELERGLRRLMLDASFATVVGTLTSGVVLVAYALYLGATPAVVGLLAAVPFLTQLLQAPAVLLLEKLRRRRLIAILSLILARLALPLMAVLVLFDDRAIALGLLVIGETIHCAFNAVGGCAWNSWIRDLVPDDRLGRFFARRTIWATIVGIAGTAIAAIALEYSGGGSDGKTFFLLYVGGFVAGAISTWQLAQVPEPPMAKGAAIGSLTALFTIPFRDRNFVRLIRFLASWQFAANLAVPFFAIFFIQQLGYSPGFVLVLSIVSQLSNLLLLRQWGALTDRYANKTVLAFATPLFIACIAAMALAAELEGTVRTAYLIVLHVLMGMTSAGVTLASNTIILKLAPRGASHVYIATAALVSAAAAGSAPLIGGALAEFFRARELVMAIGWHGPRGGYELKLSFGWWQLFFLLSALIGLYALHRLSAIEEQGEVTRRELLNHVLNTARRSVRNASTVAGLRAAVAFPAGALIELRRRGPGRGPRKSRRRPPEPAPD
jgi:MFS family permease